MKSAKLLGHAVHPMVVVFPLGLLGGAVVFDVLRLANGDPAFGVVAYWAIAAGLIGGLLAAVFGFWDWLTIPSGTRAKRVGTLHALSNVFALVFFAVSWMMRRPMPDYLPGGGALAASFVGLCIALVGGWLGGELMQRMGVGVDPDAHLDAPSSLSREGHERSHGLGPHPLPR